MTAESGVYGASMSLMLDEVRRRMGPTREARLADARKRSEEFNRRAEIDFENQRMTPELLARRCTL